MSYFVNDTINKVTLLRCTDINEAIIYASWATECGNVKSIEIEHSPYKTNAQGDLLLSYYGFSIDSLVDTVFSSMPQRSRNLINKSLIKMLLRFPELTKNECCVLTGKEPTHYSRVSRMMSNNCKLVSELSGGRNPMKLMRGIRGDL
ncbi:hypothetical protein ACFH4J_003423 [Escherichia coli]